MRAKDLKYFPAVRPISVGDRFVDEIGPKVVMATADGYAMLRRPGCAPFVVSLRNLLEGAQGRHEIPQKGVA